MRWLITYAFILFSFVGISQDNFLPTHRFYKDQIFANKLSQPMNSGSFFPITERDYNLIPAIIDSSKQYYEFTQTLFKKHVFELEGPGYYLTISPTFDFSGGRDLKDTNNRNLFQNTRGFIVEADLLNNFSFSTSFYENQSRVTQYESDYYMALGELYIVPSSHYYTQNAVIPGSGRTKFFKLDGFDYAYAVGNIVYRPIKQLTISMGNNQHFIGDGHRSLLLSDNSYSAPYIRADWKISPKFQFTYLRSRHLNLVRRPATGSVESYYESKGYSVNYFTYKPNEKLNISLFEGTVWNRGDSITSTRVHPLFYNPVPFVSQLALQNKNEINSLFGINVGVQIAAKHRAYGQLALNSFEFDKLGFQIGYRGYNFFGLNDFMVQAEYNYVPSDLYKSDNSRLNYVHYNTSLGHIRGNGFQEIVIRSNYEIKRVYAELSLSYYMFKDYEEIDLLPVAKPDIWYSPESFNALNTNLEVGYRINRKLNFTVFGAMTLRNTGKTETMNTLFFYFGLRTGLLNQYKDF